MTKKKSIWLLERTQDAASHIIGFYSTKEHAVNAVRRYVRGLIDKAIAEGNGSVVGVYISEGFLLTRSEVEVDPEVDFTKVEEKFPTIHPGNGHPVVEDLGDINE